MVTYGVSPQPRKGFIVTRVQIRSLKQKRRRPENWGFDLDFEEDSD